MKKISFIVCLFIAFLLTGCYNYRELNDLAITTAIGIDSCESGYKITAQVVNTQKSGSDSNSSNDPKIIIYTSEGKTIQEAIRKMILESPKRLYPYHMEVLMISENVAREGISDLLDIFFRDSELRKQFYVLIAKNTTTEDILKTLTPIDTLVASNISKSLEADNKYLGMSQLLDFEDLITDYLNDKKEITIPSIILKGVSEEGEKKENLEESKPKASLVINDLAIFKDDKLIDYLNKDDVTFLNIIENKLNDSIISYKCDDNNLVTIEINDIKSSIKINKDEFKINIEIKGNGNINEINCKLDIEEDKIIKELKDKLNENIVKKVNTVIEAAKNKYNSDFIGFKDYIYKNNQKLYKKIGDSWYTDIFKNLDINIKSNVNIIEKGNIVKVTNE